MGKNPLNDISIGTRHITEVSKLVLLFTQNGEGLQWEAKRSLYAQI